MNTPICDFVKRYTEENTLRLHMPGHKGQPHLGMEALDITEIDGADSLYEAAGIIKESEQNASALFGCETLYSTEGSSQCIRAMLCLAVLSAKQSGRRPLIAAGRNAHKTFLSAAALLDFDILWLQPETQANYLSCPLRADTLERALSHAPEKPTAVYITSPDYLGNLAPIRELAAVCHAHGILLLVDNAHGAYLRFLPESMHPIDLGADLCCDSAHKTLPVLTGGAYLHISPQAPAFFSAQAKTALALFGSTSPSYLILQSLDAANAYLANGYAARLSAYITEVGALKSRLTAHGFTLCGKEPTKLTISAKPYGYTGRALAELLQRHSMVCEFADPDFLVLMLTPEIGTESLNRLEALLCSIPRRAPIMAAPPAFHLPQPVCSVREAAFSVCEPLPVEKSIGRILAAASVGCPPAVPIVVCGERIDPAAVQCFQYYGIDTCTVVKED